MKNRILVFFILIISFQFSIFSQIRSSTKDVYPVNDKDKIISLNGKWKFNFINSNLLGSYNLFYQKDYNDASWSEIPVPGNWEIYGFKTPTYAYIDNVLGLYRKKFNVPAEWQNQHVFIRFEGVEFGYQLWVNGDSVGIWESSYNPCQFDITQFVTIGVENTIAVKVYTQPKGYKFDTNDDWALTGIDRSVEIFSVPDVHINDLTLTTDIVDSSNAKISLKYQVSSFSTNKLSNLYIKGNLYSTTGALIQTFSIPVPTDSSKADTSNSILVSNSKLWTAETPSLYPLDIYLCNSTDTFQYFKQKVGIRKLTIKGNVISINGTPVKFRGVCRHENDGRVGRCLTREMRLNDLDLMKRANINFIRTSHYPPPPDFIELCDSIGMYVMDEVPFGFGDEWLTNTSYLDILKTRAQATVLRDKNHPSIMIWSIGNENPYTAICDSTGRYTKRLDPTRPISYPQNGGSSESALSAQVDIFSTHYPNTSSLTQIVKSNKRPFIATEYAHSLGLAGENQKALWDIMESNSSCAGGAIWVWADQSVLRKGKSPGFGARTNDCWINDTEYYDSNGDQGTDGIVNTDRTFQTDYWEARKNYSQVVILENNITVNKGSQNIQITLKNKYDFLNLKDKLKCKWNLTEDKDTIQFGNFIPECAPHKQTVTSINVNIPNNTNERIYLLHFEFNDSVERNLYDHVIKLFPSQKNIDLLTRLDDVELKTSPVVDTLGGISKTQIKSFEFGINRKDGMIYLQDTTGKDYYISNGPYLKLGRKTTIAENISENGKFIIKYLLTQPNVKQLNNSNPLITETTYEYLTSDIRVKGNISFEPTQKGWINVDFSLSPTARFTKVLLEAGLSFLLKPEITEFRWLGYGPYPSYPGKSALNEYGIHHLNAKDIFIQGNHPGVNIAVFTDSVGNGIAMVCDSCNIDVDKTQSGLIVSFNSLVSGKSTKFMSSFQLIGINTNTIIAGKLKIIPIKGNNWPHLLNELFGESNKTVTPYRPFIAQYDDFVSKLSNYVTPSKVIIDTTNSTNINYSSTNSFLNAYPNPFNNYIIIEFKTTKKGKCNLSLYDANGVLIKSIVNADVSEGNHRFKLNDSTLSKGVYLLKLVSEENVYEKKIIKN